MMSPTLEELITVIGDERLSDGVRSRAINQLARELRNEHRLTGFLAPWLDNSSGMIAGTAIRAMPVFDPEASGELFGRLAIRGYPYAGFVAIELARRKDDRVLPRLFAWLEGEDLSLIEAALKSLRWLMSLEEESELLSRILDSREPDEGSLRIAERIDFLASKQ